MDFVEWQLWRMEPGGQTKELLSPISLQDGLNVGKLSSIRSFLEENDLLEFKFAFWNEKTGSIISQKFEKANVIKGPEVFIIPLDDVETSSKRARIQTEEEKNPLILGDSKDDETIEWQDADSQEYASLLVDLAKAPTQKPVGDRATTLETTVTVHETEVGNSPSGSLEKMRSLIMRTDEKGYWERGARNLKDKLEGEGKGDHSWWVETWDEGDHAVAHIWCNECKKHQGTGKVHQYSNTFSNFWKQHIPTTLHKTEYNRRVGNDKIAKERSATERVALAIAEQRKRVTNAVQLIKAANDQEGHQSFLIDGDVENETLSGKDVKWKCVFCGTPHLLMPKTNNLASILQQHMAGDRHIQKKKQALEDLANQTPLRSGQCGRPTWKSKMVEDKQPGIKVFFKATPKGLNKGSSGASSSKGINDQSTLCWGLWQDTVIVNGEVSDIKPFLLDQLRGKLWYSEPYVCAKLHFPNSIKLVKGCFRHINCKRINANQVSFTNFTCDVCATIPQEKDYYCRVWREQRSIEKRGQWDTGNGRRFEVLSIEELPKVVREKNRSYRKVVRENWMLKVKLMRFKAKKKSFSRVQEEFANRSEVSLFVTAL
ncbi:unnamed protein product [Calypogeia fissa]